MTTHALEPTALFRRIDATDINSESYEFQVGDVDDLSEEPNPENVTTIEVSFEDLSDPDDDFLAALDKIQSFATEVDSVDEVPDSHDTQFETTEDGNLVTYYCDTSRMGYEIVRQEEPRLAAYTVVFPDRIVKVVE